MRKWQCPHWADWKMRNGRSKRDASLIFHMERCMPGFHSHQGLELAVIDTQRIFLSLVVELAQELCVFRTHGSFLGR
jgi:hypothetical protein